MLARSVLAWVKRVTIQRKYEAFLLPDQVRLQAKRIVRAGIQHRYDEGRVP